MNNEQHKYQDRWAVYFIAILMNVVLVSLFLAEHLPIKGGVAWDGEVYGMIARTFPEFLRSRSLDPYYIGRILPSSLVACTARLFGFAINNQYLVAAFALLNIACINLSYFLLVKSLRLLHVAGRAITIVLLLGFCNFFVLKALLYSPVNTDAFSLAIGSGLLYAYTTDRRWLLLLLGMLGAFTQPLIPIASILLFVYRKREEDEKIRPFPSSLFSLLPYAGGISVFAGYLVLRRFRLSYLSGNEANFGAPVDMNFFLLSVLLLSVYVFILLKAAVQTKLAERLISELRWKPVLIVLCLFGAIKTIQYFLGGPSARHFFWSFVLNILVSPIREPLQFLVAHITFWGIGILIIITFFRSYLSVVSKLGTGYLAIIILICVMAINSESRQCGALFPFLMLPLGVLLKDVNIKAGHVVFTAILSLGLSKIWLFIHGSPALINDLQQNPYQRFFLNMGPWMAPHNYLIQLVLFVPLAWLVYGTIRNSGRTISA